MGKKRVMHIFEGQKAGETEIQILHLLKALDGGVLEPEILCLSAGELAAAAEMQGIRTGIIEARNILDRSVIALVQEYIKSRDADLIHSHDIRANIIGRLAAKKENLPLLSTHKPMKLNSASVFETALLKYLSRITAKYSDGFLASTLSIEKELRRMRIPAEKIHLLYNAVDSRILLPLPDSPKSREKLGLDGEKLTVTMFAGLSREEEYECFLRAAGMVVDTGIKTQFIIYAEAQPGKSYPAAQRYLGKVKQQELFRIITPGQYPREDIYSSSNLIYSPSGSGELEQFILGAMFHGISLIASSNSDIAEIIEDRSTGLLVKAADHKELGYAIMKILIDKDLREIIQARSRKKAEDFSLEKNARRVEKIYEELLKAR